ncbi:MAG: hypothetical protein R3C61_09925 [Bacteroidia bacterium]
MAVTYVSPTLPASSPQLMANRLSKKFELTPEHDKDATNALLMLQAVANISGWKMEAEFARLGEIIGKYQALSREIQEMAEGTDVAGEDA